MPKKPTAKKTSSSKKTTSKASSAGKKKPTPKATSSTRTKKKKTTKKKKKTMSKRKSQRNAKRARSSGSASSSAPLSKSERDAQTRARKATSSMILMRAAAASLSSTSYEEKFGRKLAMVLAGLELRGGATPSPQPQQMGSLPSSHDRRSSSNGAAVAIPPRAVPAPPVAVAPSAQAPLPKLSLKKMPVKVPTPPPPPLSSSSAVPQRIVVPAPAAMMKVPMKALAKVPVPRTSAVPIPAQQIHGNVKEEVKEENVQDEGDTLKQECKTEDNIGAAAAVGVKQLFKSEPTVMKVELIDEDHSTVQVKTEGLKQEAIKEESDGDDDLPIADRLAALRSVKTEPAEAGTSDDEESDGSSDHTGTGTDDDDDYEDDQGDDDDEEEDDDGEEEENEEDDEAVRHFATLYAIGKEIAHALKTHHRTAASDHGRTLYTHLADPLNSVLRRRIAEGEITPDALVRMHVSELMNPTEREKYEAENAERSRARYIPEIKRIEAAASVSKCLECPQCGAKEATVMTKCGRSSDSQAMTFAECLKCGAAFRA